jgi:beta-N-acetylhexosaminidase
MRHGVDRNTQIGQAMIVGFDGVALTAKLRTMLQTIQPGGIILFARNIREPRQTWELLRESQRCVATPLFLCVDMEGGTVDRLREVIAPAPSAADVFAGGNRELFRRHGQIIGQECRALGFNTDFAPVVDLAFEQSRAVLSSRAVSTSSAITVTYARAFMQGLKEGRVLGCGKHFPGLGAANLDTHHELACIEKSWKSLWGEDLAPYRTLHRRMPFIMVAHAAYPAVTGNREPASLSRKWITQVLRKRMGFRGLVLSDDLEMGGVQAALPIGEAAVATLEAGAHMFLVCHKEASVWETYRAVIHAAEHDQRFARKVAEAAQHVLAAKKRWPELKRPAPGPTPEKVNRLRRALWEFAEEIRLATV